MRALLEKDFGEKRKLASKTESSFRRAFFELFRKDLGENKKEASGRKKKL